MNKRYYVYILTNKNNNVFYTGVTNNLLRRVFEHKQKVVEGFTHKYNVNKLIYYEIYQDIKDAIEREKQIKGGSRQKKIGMIQRFNVEWKDLWNDIT